MCFFLFSTNLVFPDYDVVSSDGGPHILVSIQANLEKQEVFILTHPRKINKISTTKA